VKLRTKPVCEDHHLKNSLDSDDQALALAEALARELAPRAVVRERAGTLPREELARLSASGLLGATIPRTYGGADVGHATAAELVRILTAVDAGLGRIVLDHLLCVARLAHAGAAELQRRVFAGLLAGQRLAHAVVEGPEGARARLTREGATDGYHLAGQKFRCAGVMLADWLAVRALDERSRAVTVWIERAAEGVTLLDLDHDADLRAIASGAVLLEGVAVEPWRIVAADPGRVRGLDVREAQELLLHAALDAGIAEAAWSELLELVR
jgi:alkylation response protein AidB-like acyl-CoA dehydrogenase